jgi:ribosomal protein S18 acetylase RimI-like enzyme
MKSICASCHCLFLPERGERKRRIRQGLHSASVRELDAAWSFEVAIQDRCSTQLVPFEWGTALFRSDMPRVHDQNLLRVEHGFEELTAKGLVSEADRVQRPVGLAHRKVLVPQEAAGERVASGFVELGWRAARHVVMAHRGAAPADPRHPVRELEPNALREARTRTFEQDLGGTAAEQVTASLELIATVVPVARAFAVEAAGQVVSWCVLYEEDGIGEIDDVVTAMQYRRRGFARAVVEAATRASRRSGNRLTFLVADDEDWPKAMYARLGFEQIGRRYEFTLT